MQKIRVKEKFKTAIALDRGYHGDLRGKNFGEAVEENDSQRADSMMQ